jgi:hypothetical protein
VHSPVSQPRPRSTTAAALYNNCTNLNKKYPHGLGRLGARDHTSGTPVTNFKRSTKHYKVAMSYNRGLDRDKDGVACEKHYVGRATGRKLGPRPRRPIDEIA